MKIKLAFKHYQWFALFLFIITIGFFSYTIFAENNSSIRESKNHYEKGVNLLNGNNIIGAIQEIEKAVELYPDNQFAHFKLGLIYLEKTKAKYYDKAPIHFKKVIEIVKDPSDSYYIDSYFYLGISYLQLGQYDEAISAFKEVLAIDSNYPEAIKIHNYLGVAYYYKDNYEQAIPQFKASLQMDSHFKLANFNLKSVNMRLEHYNIGITYFFMKNYEEAIKEFAIAIEIDTNYFAAHLMLGECYLKKGIYTEAIREFQRAMMINPTHPDIPKILNKLGIIYYLQEKYKEAIFSLRKALELDPENSEAITNLRNVYQNYENQEVKMLDKEKQKDRYVKAHLDLADDYYLIGMFKEALKEYQAVFEADSGNDAVYQKLKTTYKKLTNYYLDEKQYDNAIPVLKKMIQMEPENEQYHYLIGKSYYLQGKFWAKEAVEELKKAPSLKSSYYYLAKAYLELAKTKDAIAAFERASELDEKNVKIPEDLGDLYYKIADYEKAYDTYKKAYSLAPNNAEIKRKIERTYNQLQTKAPTSDEGPVIKEDTAQSLNKEAIAAAQGGYMDSAHELLLKAIEKKQDSGFLYNNLANITFFKGVLDESLANYLMADSFNPNNAEIYINTAICFYKLKDFDSAEKYYQKAVKISKKYTEKYKFLATKGSDSPQKIDLIWLEF